jgi:hypothetical protein
MRTFDAVALTLMLSICTLLPAQSPQVMQEDFDGASLGPAWEVYQLQGSISVSGGFVHISIPQAGSQLVQFPCLRAVPGIGILPSTIWIVETRLQWLLTPPIPNYFNGTTHFAACHNVPGAVLGCPSSGTYIVPDCPVYAGWADNTGLTIRSGAVQMTVPIDTALHTYRWVSDGMNVAFYLDSAFVFSGPHDGHQPNNFVLGSHCGLGGNKWNGLSIDQIRVVWGQILDGPASAAIGGSINYALALPPATPYFLDVSVNGTSPGILYGPANLVVPLNPPYLNQDIGALLPGVFVGFLGTSGPTGLASASVNLPFEPALAGLTLSAAYVTLNPMVPGGVSGVAQPVSTAITGP